MKQKDIKVAFFVIGGAFKLRKEKVKRADGSLEYLNLVKSLCRCENISELLLFSNNDFDKLTLEQKQELDPRSIINNIKSNIKINNEIDPLSYQNLQKYLIDNNIDYDFGIGFGAQGYSRNAIPDFLYSIRNPEQKVKLLTMTFNYSSHLIHHLNSSKKPWFLIVNDPRYLQPIEKKHDTVNFPSKIISQYDTKIIWEHIQQYQDNSPIIKDEIEVFYSGIEKLNLVDLELIDPSIERNIRFTISSMQSTPTGSKKDQRFEILRDWILKYDKDHQVNIWGDWDEYYTKDFPQFKGYIDIQKMDEQFHQTKYTLVIPIRPNWVTSKYAEVLQCGVVPFFHTTYDTQNHIVPHDHFIRVSSSEELYEKMDLLDKHDELRIDLVRELQQQLISNVKDGSFMKDIINQTLRKAKLPFIV